MPLAVWEFLDELLALEGVVGAVTSAGISKRRRFVEEGRVGTPRPPPAGADGSTLRLIIRGEGVFKMFEENFRAKERKKTKTGEDREMYWSICLPLLFDFVVYKVNVSGSNE